jgi:hypothetical protein
MRYGAYRVLLEQIPRIRAEEMRDAVVVAHTADPAELVETLAREADPSDAWWMREPDSLNEIAMAVGAVGQVERR